MSLETDIKWEREQMIKEAEAIRAARRPYTSDAEIARKTADVYVKYLDRIDALKMKRDLKVAQALMEDA